MHNLTTLKNGLTLITVDLPHLESVTSLIAVGAGSRYEGKQNNGISHFLEHMFFKGSKKYPSAVEISTIIDGMGAVNNAFTYKEYTAYWIKSSAKNLEKASDILSSMVKESLLLDEEINREKGVIVEEIRMYKDDPAKYVWSLYERLQFGDHPLGWDVIGAERIVQSFKREDFVSYIDKNYSALNMALVFAGKLPKDIKKLAQNYFGDIQQGELASYQPYKEKKQSKPVVDVYFKDTDQAKVILGVYGHDRSSDKRYAERVLAAILGEGMSSRLWIQVRERRGLAYYVFADDNYFKDSGYFIVSAGLKLEKLEEGIKVMVDELSKIAGGKPTSEELKKAKELIRGRIAIRSESSNFLAEHFGLEYVLDKKIETFEEYLKKIDRVTEADIQNVAKDLFQKNKFNLQIIGPFKDPDKFSKLLS